MKQLLFATFIFATNVCLAQNYEESLEKCTEVFHGSVDPNNLRDLESNVERQIIELKNCIRGLKFPSFNITSIKNKSYSLDDLKGKVVLINLWFIGCPPCVAEIPIFNELTAEFSDKDFVILSFARDNAKSIKKFIKKRPIEFSVFANAKDLIKNKFKMGFGYPTNIFLNKNGEIVDFKIGAGTDEPALNRMKKEMKELIEKELTK